MKASGEDVSFGWQFLISRHELINIQMAHNGWIL